MLSKKCQFCNNVFYKKVNCSLKQWNTRVKFCSKDCFNKSKIGTTSCWKGKKRPEVLKWLTPFKKGNIPWTKGKKFPECSGENSPNWKPKTKINCKQCGKERLLAPWEVKAGTKFCSAKCYHKWHRGKNSPVWTDNYKMNFRNRIMQLPEYKEWKTTVFANAKHICQRCNEKFRSMEAHHIKPFRIILKENNIKTIEEARECKELWDVKNGKALCKKCHCETDTYRNKFK